MPPTFLLALLLQTTPKLDPDLVKVLWALAGGIVVGLFNRWVSRRDKSGDAARDGKIAAEKLREDRLKKMEEHAANQEAKNMNFQQLIEHMGDEVKKIVDIVNSNKERVLRGEMRDEATKEHLQRIETLTQTAISRIKP